VTVRPARPEDTGRIGAYIRGLSFASRYTRFLGPVNELAPADLHRMTHGNDAAPPALIVESGDGDARAVVGEARYAFDGIACEFALSVSDAWRGKGVGTLLMGIIEERAQLRGAHYLVGDVFRSNQPMLELARKPKNTPPDIVEKLNKEINAALVDSSMQARIANFGYTVFASSPADFGKFIAEETEKWGKVIRAANIKPD
jgi:GNAT superfamily N-acetyltransferase